jgi:ABC-2 type transport system ATP-binding protein
VRRASSDANVRVGTPRAEELREALSLRGAQVERVGEGLLEVGGLTGQQIGEIALDSQIVVSELTPQSASLEEAFMSLTGDAVEYRASAGEDDSPARALGAPA